MLKLEQLFFFAKNVKMALTTRFIKLIKYYGPDVSHAWKYLISFWIMKSNDF